MTQTLGAAGNATHDPTLAARVLADPPAFAMAGLDLHGLVALSQGFMLTCMIWSAISAHLIDRRFRVAAVWAAIGAVIAFFGFVHAGSLTPAGGMYDIGWASGWRWSVGYAACAVLVRRGVASRRALTPAGVLVEGRTRRGLAKR